MGTDLLDKGMVSISTMLQKAGLGGKTIDGIWYDELKDAPKQAVPKEVFDSIFSDEAYQKEADPAWIDANPALGDEPIPLDATYNDGIRRLLSSLHELRHRENRSSLDESYVRSRIAFMRHEMRKSRFAAVLTADEKPTPALGEFDWLREMDAIAEDFARKAAAQLEWGMQGTANYLRRLEVAHDYHLRVKAALLTDRPLPPLPSVLSPTEADTLEKLRRSTLAWVNTVRAHFGLGVLNALPPAHPRDPRRCVVARALGDIPNALEVHFSGTAMRVLFPGQPPLRINAPVTVRTFVKAFDCRLYPDLDLAKEVGF